MFLCSSLTSTEFFYWCAFFKGIVFGIKVFLLLWRKWCKKWFKLCSETLFSKHSFFHFRSLIDCITRFFSGFHKSMNFFHFLSSLVMFCCFPFWSKRCVLWINQSFIQNIYTFFPNKIISEKTSESFVWHLSQSVVVFLSLYYLCFTFFLCFCFVFFSYLTIFS